VAGSRFHLSPQHHGRVAVVSQVNSTLWVGQSIRYGNIEGVDWINPTRIVTVSDRRKKKNQPDKGFLKKDQSLRVFDILSQGRLAGMMTSRTGARASPVADSVDQK
jgi:hypothetical protein